jgi:DNA polymerase zeta
LVMEPQSNFYTSPLLVLDFQSLYPSIVIAYNYWYQQHFDYKLAHISYSTCLGRVERLKNQNKMGFTTLQLPDRVLELLKDDINGNSISTYGTDVS